jgi:DNA-binding response OmpR family regulator
MNERILVVDDEESLRLSLKFKLKSAGFDVDTAVDGEEALEKLKTRPVDCVLLDINMPHMSGIEALTIIRQTYPQTEAIMLTGFADFSTAIECLKIGAKDYLVKPVDTTELVTRLRTLVRSRSTERALQEVHREYLGLISEDVLAPLQTMKKALDQLAKSGDAEKERKKIVNGMKETLHAMEGKLELLVDLSKRGSTTGGTELNPADLTEQLKALRKKSK